MRRQFVQGTSVGTAGFQNILLCKILVAGAMLEFLAGEDLPGIAVLR
ncbi:MAG: hypothetical protein AAB345_04270 [Patescibacteria group bacterium]